VPQKPIKVKHHNANIKNHQNLNKAIALGHSERKCCNKRSNALIVSAMVIATMAGLRQESGVMTGILRKSSGFGVFAKIFSKNIYSYSLKRDSIFWQGSPNGFGQLSPNLVSSVFFGLPNCQIRVICLFG
jgi:hypothetical protein